MEVEVESGDEEEDVHLGIDWIRVVERGSGGGGVWVEVEVAVAVEANAQVLFGALQLGSPRLLRLDEIAIPPDARLP